MASTHKPPILLWLGIELTLLALLSAGAWFVSVETASLWVSCLLGGMVAIVPHAYFAGLAWRFSGARSAPWVVKSFYRGESGKFVLTLVGFGLIFTSPLPVQPLMLFATYCLFLAVQVGLAARQA
ncbi:ATP synthase subunit I [Simiduia sp. 21SJ11W-1]|uniref:ATP synthase subunit I n=1 Tax=Simiduia sp. 21SJ11W-1 TaxID=2909669 RepID=UPI0020A1AFA9|nr:ATP synthase subunit I [Simiduia sp. 21SJ11W-1]UTA47944.1 ATP synthase subunit I [Simiduia sp. 21SJ11W-1]